MGLALWLGSRLLLQPACAMLQTGGACPVSVSPLPEARFEYIKGRYVVVRPSCAVKRSGGLLSTVMQRCCWALSVLLWLCPWWQRCLTVCAVVAMSVGVWSRRDEPCVHMPVFCAPGSSVVLGPQCMGPAVVCLKILRELLPPPLWWLLAARLDAQAGVPHAACARAQVAQQRLCCAVLLPVCGLSACVGAVSMTRSVINALGCLSCFRAGHRLRSTLCCSWRPLCLRLHD